MIFIYLKINNMEWFIQIHRKILEWWWYNDINVKVLFLHILFTANYTEKVWRWVTILPWQLLSWRKSLSKDTWLTESQVRTALDKLISTWEIAINSTNEYSILTLNNWDTYNQPIAKRIANESPTSRQRVATTNNINKDNKDINRNSNNILVIQEHLKTLQEGTRYNFYTTMIENIEQIQFELDIKWIQGIEKKLLDFNKTLWQDKAKLELENFWLHHSINKTVMKSVILRLNTWLNNKIK